MQGMAEQSGRVFRMGCEEAIMTRRDLSKEVKSGEEKKRVERRRKERNVIGEQKRR